VAGEREGSGGGGELRVMALDDAVDDGHIVVVELVNDDVPNFKWVVPRH